MRTVPATLILALVTMAALPAAALDGKLGVQLMSMRSNFSGELPDEGSWEGLSGLGGGILVELDVLPDVSVSLQPNVTPRQARQEFERRGEVTGAIDYRADYLSIPLVVRVAGRPLGVSGFVTAGLDLSILLDASYDDGAGEIDFSDDLNGTNLGALFGAGALIPVGRQLLVLELRYVQGLDDIFDRAEEDRDAGLTSPSVKYRGIQLIAGFAFRLGGR